MTRSDEEDDPRTHSTVIAESDLVRFTRTPPLLLQAKGRSGSLQISAGSLNSWRLEQKGGHHWHWADKSPQSSFFLETASGLASGLRGLLGGGGGGQKSRSQVDDGLVLRVNKGNVELSSEGPDESITWLALSSSSCHKLRAGQ